MEMGGFGAATVNEEYFARLCYEIDSKMGEPAGCRFAINWFDETPRDQMRAQLIPEITLELARRKESECPAPLATTV